MNEETKRFILWVSKVDKWNQEAIVLCKLPMPQSAKELKSLWDIRLRQWVIDTGLYQGPFSDFAYIGYDRIQWSLVIKHFRKE